MNDLNGEIRGRASIWKLDNLSLNFEILTKDERELADTHFAAVWLVGWIYNSSF